MPRGIKTCKSCGATTGPRAYVCKECGAKFNVDVGATLRTRKKKGIKFNWRELMPGDYFRTKSGSGPCFILPNGECEPMGYSGIFRVAYLDGQGIHAYPADKKNSGHCYIYMGREKKTSIGMLRRPHKIRKLTQKPVITNTSMARNM